MCALKAYSSRGPNGALSVPGSSVQFSRRSQHMTTDTTQVPSGDEALITRASDLWSRKPARIRDVQLEISAQIGRTRLPIRTVLELAVGQVIELDRQVGDAIDIIANNDVVIARGEVVEIDEEYGVRITEVIQGA